VETLRILAALAGVRLGAQPVHRAGQRLVGFAGDRAVAHRARREALDDLADRLHLVDRDRPPGRRVELEQAAQRHQAPGLVVDAAGVLAEDVVPLGAGGVLQPEHGLGVEQVRRPLAAPLVLAADVQGAVGDPPVVAGVRPGVPAADLLGDLGEPDALDATRGAGEVPVDERAGQADGLEDHRAGVGRQRRDPHLAHHLEDALAERLADVVDGPLGRDGQVELVAGQVLGRLEAQVRVDRRGTVGDEERHVVHLADVAGLDDQAGLGAQLLADEVLVHGRGQEQRRDRRLVRVGVPVGQDDGSLAAADGVRHLGADLVEAGGQGVPAVMDVVEAPDDVGVEFGTRPVPVDAHQLGELVGVEDRVGDDDLVAGVRAGFQQVRLGPDRRGEGGDHLLADGVQRGVGHLREELAEVVEQQPGPLGQHGQRGVGAHRPDGLRAGLGHGGDDHLHLLVGVAEHLVTPQHRTVRVDHVRPLGQIVHVELPREPLGVRLFVGEAGLDLGVVDQPVLVEVDQQHAAGPEASLLNDLVGRQVEHARLGGEDDETVVGDPEASGTQAVAVERGAHQGAVGEADGGGAVPGLHEGGVEAVEVAAAGVHGGVVLPGLGDHHHHRVGQGAAAEVQQLEHLVEGRRVGVLGRHDGKGARQVAGDEVGAEQRLAGPHPVAVALDGVDLAVVGEQPEGVRQLPRREGVRREPGVHERQRRLDALVGQVGEHLAQLLRGEHALVDGGPGRQRREVDAGLVLGPLA